jgi:RNA polymerase sigma factor (sigma-70 family)
VASSERNPIVCIVRRIAASGELEAASDGELLLRFLGRRDEAAFTALVRRHGPMVLTACRRVLRDPNDAEDAFQATFLVLVRKAASIRRPELLGNWLYGVAYRTALRARTDGASRRAREQPLVDVPGANPAPALEWTDLRPVLDEEINRLPARYRVAFVLCHLEGKTNEEAARLLGCPKGTVLSRLAWARARLRAWLTRRGLTLAAGAIVVASSHANQAVGVPLPLLAATFRAARLSAAPGVISTRVASLTEGVLRTMLLARLKIALALVVSVGLLVLGIGLRSLAAQDQSAPEKKTETPKREAVVQADKEPAVSVKTLPPVVVRTVPAAGDVSVDATKTSEIRVTFSKDMADNSWSWSQISDETFPKITGKIRYDKDKRTCILPVKLEPGKTYVIWLNSEKFENFKDADGKPAVPYLLVFETKR